MSTFDWSWWIFATNAAFNCFFLSHNEQTAEAAAARFIFARRKRERDRLRTNPLSLLLLSCACPLCERKRVRTERGGRAHLF